MASLSTLCRACHDALYAEKRSFEQPQYFCVYQNHHLTIDSFLSAALRQCFVCHIVYNNVNYQTKILLSEPCVDAAATMYRIRSKGGQQGLQFVVIFLWRRPNIETKFQLLPTSGMCRGGRLTQPRPAANYFTILQTLSTFPSFLAFSSTQTPPRPLHWTWPCNGTSHVVQAILYAAASHSAAQLGYRVGCCT
jgi:hypothetical protein